jgi:D-sedoheptulose 7-phosphate isomerase
MNKILERSLIESRAVHEELYGTSTWKSILLEVVGRTVESLAIGGKVLFAGNGGSAADAQHLSAEFTGRFNYDRAPLFSEALHCNTSYLTAVANDYSYDEVYARLLRGIGRKGDILFGLSTSGNSANLLRAFATARELGILTVAMTGRGGGKMRELADFCLEVPSNQTPRIQECHILMGHLYCELVEREVFPRES